MIATSARRQPRPPNAGTSIRNERLAKRPRRCSERLAEGHAEPCRVRESAGQRDFGDRKFAAAKQLFAAFESHAANLLGRRSTQVRAELNFQTAPRDRHLAQNILHDDAVVRVRANISQCAHDRRIVNRQHVGRLTANHAVRRDQHGLRRSSSPAIMRCSIAAASWPSRSQATETLDSGGVDTSHSSSSVSPARIATSSGMRTPREVTNLGELPRVVRIDAKNRNRPRQRREPAIHAPLLFFPTDLSPCPIAGLILVALVAELSHRAVERLAAILRVAIAGRREVGELAKAAGDQMLEREPRAFVLRP